MGFIVCKQSFFTDAWEFLYHITSRIERSEYLFLAYDTEQSATIAQKSIGK